MTVLLNGMQVSVEGLFECSYFKLQELLHAIIGLLNEQAAVQGQLRTQREEDKAGTDKGFAEIGAKLNSQKGVLFDRLEALEKMVTGIPGGNGLEQRLNAVEGQVWGATPGGENGLEQRLSAVESQVTSGGSGAVSFDQRLTALEDQAATMAASASQLEALGDKLRQQMQNLKQQQQQQGRPTQATAAEELSRWHQLRAQVASLQTGLDDLRKTSAVIEERLSSLEGAGQPPDGSEEDPATAGMHDDRPGARDSMFTPLSEHESACGYMGSATASTAPPSCRGQSGGRRGISGGAAGTGGTDLDTARTDVQQEKILGALHQEIDAAKSDGAMALACHRKLEDRMSELERSLVDGIRDLKNKPLRRLDHSLRALEATVHTDVQPNLKAVIEREAASKAKLAADIKALRLVVQALEAAGAAGTSRCISCFQLRHQEQDPIVYGDDGKVYKLRPGTPSEVLSESSWAMPAQRPTSAAMVPQRRSSSRATARTTRCKTPESLPVSSRTAIPTSS
mmetsp:Transcript_39699/g.76069  ORF Transcript_39699/g.76069 Transcript_39699/m.76069 type:complete len:510 (+) Transcript_39699:95-1624(+)